jgi:DNA-binding response OmpR family regulator
VPSTRPSAAAARGGQATVLLVEDNTVLREALGLTLSRAGMRAVFAADGAAGLDVFATTEPDVVVLDLGLPVLDGWQVLARIREQSDVPVLMLTAQSLEHDKVRGLEAGADDYLAKPFGTRELLARIRALARRPRTALPATSLLRVESAELELDVRARIARLRGEPLELTPVEWRLLLALVRERGRALSRAELLALAWDDPAGIGPDRVKYAVLRLRRKLGAAGALIESVRGFGYRLV